MNPEILSRRNARLNFARASANSCLRASGNLRILLRSLPRTPEILCRQKTGVFLFFLAYEGGCVCAIHQRDILPNREGDLGKEASPEADKNLGIFSSRLPDPACLFTRAAFANFLCNPAVFFRVTRR